MKNIYIIFIVLLILILFKNEIRNYFKNFKIEYFSDIEFDVYLINMKKNTDRLNHFMDKFNSSDLKNTNLIVFPAIVGRDIELSDYVTPEAYKQILNSENTQSRKYHYELTLGAVGCYLSHLNIYKKIIESDKKYGLIFEDDATIPPNFYSKLTETLNNIPDDWDIFMCGMMCLNCSNMGNYINLRRFWGTHAYLIKKRSSKLIYNMLNKLINKQIDADLSLLVKNKKIKIYGIDPSFVKADTFRSNIQYPIKKEETIDEFSEEFNQKHITIFKKN